MKTENKDLQCCVTHCETPINREYWEERWQKNETGWDLGTAAPAITEYMSQYPNKDDSILIPGCGNAYEAEFLRAQGFTNITLIDISPKAATQLRQKFQAFKEISVICEDFFRHEGKYDVIIEQTFFCAIPVSRRTEYAEKMAALLNPGGRIIGVLFDRQFDQPFPPFGGCPCEYKPIFEPHFEIKTMAPCNNSVPARAGTEVFINLLKK